MVRKKILLLGASGMAGHLIYYYLRSLDKYDIIDVVYRKKHTEYSLLLDITNKDDIEKTVIDVCPNIIINCIGVLIKGSQEYPDNAIYVNAYFPHFLKRISDRINAKLIHISTDCVFSGKKGDYAENDFRDADDIYGRSKALGEIIDNKNLTIRTSIIGPELKADGEGLFHWFMSQKGQVSGYVNAVWGGVTTLELAKAIDVAIDENLIGLVQLSNGCGINKYDLLGLIKKVWSRSDIDIIPFETNNKMDKSIQKSNRFKYNVKSYEVMMTELYEWMQEHNDLYCK
jgi:dTDP-4-dehydrorhamnose reductase